MNSKCISIVSLVLLLSIFLFSGLVYADITTTLDIQISSSSDDASEDDTTNVVTTSDTTHTLNSNSTVGLRFDGVTIPPGHTITKAYIQFTAATISNTDLGSYTIIGENSGNPTTYTATDNDITGRAYYETVSWTSVPQWDTIGQKYQSADISTIIQYAIDNNGFVEENAIAFEIYGSVGNTGERTFVTADDDPNNAPLLHIEYTELKIDVRVSESADDAMEYNNLEITNSDATMDLVNNTSYGAAGLRFQNISIPQGAYITKAFIEFTAAAISSETSPNITIRGEDIGSAPAFDATNDGDVSGRTFTGQKVQWTNIPEWAVDETYQTPDLSAVVQEIVGRSDWVSTNNTMVFCFTGSGSRIARTYDDDSTKAPRLYIEYAVDPAVPYMTVDTSNVSATCYKGDTAQNNTFTLHNSGAVSLTYTLSDNVSWAACTPSGGNLAAGAEVQVTVTYTDPNLADGTYEGIITIDDSNDLAPNDSVEIALSLIVYPEPVGTCSMPIYAQEDLLSPDILLLLDSSGSMNNDMTITAMAPQQTPDLKVIVQHLVNRVDWNSGNPMVFLFDKPAVGGKRSANAFKSSNPGIKPTLHVSYGTDQQITVSVSSSKDDARETIGGTKDGNVSTKINSLELGDYLVGVRFQDVQIPKGATISKAYIEFSPSASDSTSLSLDIYGEDLSQPPAFSGGKKTKYNLSKRVKTTETVQWSNIPSWTGPTVRSRMDIAHDVLSNLVTDDGVSFGFGTWTGNYDSNIDYTKVHVGVKAHTETHETDLQTAINNATPGGFTPLVFAMDAAKEYFTKNKKDLNDEYYTGDTCKPKFLILITDGMGNIPTASNSAEYINWVETRTNTLCNNNITPVAIGFGLDNAVQLEKFATVANNRGNADDTDHLYALHPDADKDGNGEPFLANNEEELTTALNDILNSIRTNVFHGSAPAPTTSTDLGDTVVVAEFSAVDWNGDLKAIGQNPSTGVWDVIKWRASDEMPITSERKVFTIDTAKALNPTSADVIAYESGTLTNDNYLCKKIGDIINSIPKVVGSPPYFYRFQSYQQFKRNIVRDTLIYIGSNDGLLHVFHLDGDTTAGKEKWAFLPGNLQQKIDQANVDAKDMCHDDYCHQYYVDGSPQAADIFYKDASGTEWEKWRTILVTGEGRGGEAYFALDITTGEPLIHPTSPSESSTFLWQFMDTQLGQTWAEPIIERVSDTEDAFTNTTWGVFFGSGYATTDQDKKEAYLFGIDAYAGTNLWKNESNTSINRIKMSPAVLKYDNKTSDFSLVAVGETITGSSSTASGKIVGVDDTTGELELEEVNGDFIDNEYLNVSGTIVATVNGTIEGLRLNDALSPPLAADMDDDTISECIYVGNQYGTLYRVLNIGKNETPTVSTLFDFYPTNTTADVNPIRAKATYAYSATSNEIWVFFGTGRFETLADKNNTNVQYFFGLKDNLTRPTHYSNTVSPMQAKFLTDTGTISGTTHEIRWIDGTAVPDSSWSIELYNGQTGWNGPSTTGSERILEKPIVVSGLVIFTAFMPDSNACSGDGDTWVFAVDYLSGSSPSKPVFDLNGDGVVDDNDKATDSSGNTYIPAAVKLIGKGSGPVLQKDVLFVTTTTGGLKGLDVNLENRKIRLDAWKEKF